MKILLWKRQEPKSAMIWLRYSLQSLLVFDGDRLLVTNNQTLVTAAERNMREIVPLFYNMGKAAAEEITPDNLYKGLLLAYNGGNIGAPSNDITKIWNNGQISEEQLKVVKWLCSEVNYIIDYSKTLYKPTRPKWVNEIIVQYTKAKVPHFFQYAKQKKPTQVEPTSECVVDRIKKLYPSKRLSFNFKQDNIGKFDYRFLMNDPNTEFIQDIADRFKEITSNLNFNNTSDEKMYNYFAIYDKAREDILSTGYDINTVVDVIILDLFVKRKTPMKKAFWTLFGDIVYQNLCCNLTDNYIQCERCKKRFYKTSNNQKYCGKCAGYQKQNTKQKKCCDCGAEFSVDARNMKKVRCDTCQKEYRKKWDRERKKEKV